MNSEQAQLICNFPERLHPVSEMIMNLFDEGRIGVVEFMRYFSLPNSDYIDLAYCYVTMITGLPPFGLT